MRGKTRSVALLLCALCALLAAGIVASSAAAKAKSHNVHMKITKPCAQKGTRICGTYGGSPLNTKNGRNCFSEMSTVVEMRSPNPVHTSDRPRTSPNW